MTRIEKMKKELYDSGKSLVAAESKHKTAKILFDKSEKQLAKASRRFNEAYTAVLWEPKL